MGRRALWLRWLVLVSSGELAGFSLVAAVGIWSRDMSAGAQLAMLPLAGLFEGAALGLAQAVVFRRCLPGFRAPAWVVATSLAAAVAWFLGMLPSTTHETWSAWSPVWVVVSSGVLGTALLASIGTGQALVLPRGVRRPAAWVGWTALGWSAGLTAFTAVASPLWHEGQALWATVLIGLAGGLAMALAMAVVTGVGAVQLVGATASSPAKCVDRDDAG